MAEIGIIIVTHNSADVIGPCLEAAAAANADVLVVDNASSDGTAQLVSRSGARLIANTENRGFAGAVNQGFAALDCAYCLLLNPDAVLTSRLEPLRDACLQPHAAGAGGLLLDHHDRPQVGFMVRKFPTPSALALESLLLNRIWPKNPINVAYRSLHLDCSRLQAVEQPAGAFLMIRRAVWEELGGFDENFWPLWFEDVDFCRRAANRGYLWYYTPQAVAKHTGAHSISKLTLEMRRIYWYRSLLRYAVKHFGARGVRAVCVAVATGSVLRMVLESALQWSRKPVGAYSQVIRLAVHAFIDRGDHSVSSVRSS